MRGSTSAVLLFVAGAAGALISFASLDVGCKGDHSALAPGSGGAGSTSSTSKSAAATTSSAGGAAPISEPDGPTRFTFVNGVVDEPSVTFCFVPASGTSNAPPFPAGGLAFGHAYVSPVGSTDIPSGDGILFAIAGTLPDGTTCGDVAADPVSFPDALVAELGLVPASALAMRRSFLFVPDGCFGDVSHTSSSQAQVCGMAYSAENPNPGLTVLAMSRITNAGRVGFQYVNGVAATLKLDASIVPGVSGASPSTIATSVPLGGALPYPPSFALGASGVGAVGSASVVSDVPQGSMMSTNVVLANALGASGLGSGDVANGKDLVFVGVGASPGTPSGPWWNDFTVVAIASDPPSQ